MGAVRGERKGGSSERSMCKGGSCLMINNLYL